MIHIRTGRGTFTFNGIGVEVCEGRALVKWARGMPSDHDAVQCFVVFWLPVVPIMAMHRSVRGGKIHDQPIPLTIDLLAWAFARRWLYLVLGLGLLLPALPLWTRQPYIRYALGAGLFGFALWLTHAFRNWDQRARNIRRLLLPHDIGSSDPATWPHVLLRSVPKPMEMFGTPTFADAVPSLYQGGEFNRAMWAARLATAIENRRQGEDLTNAILEQPEVQEAIAQHRRDASQWPRFGAFSRPWN